MSSLGCTSADVVADVPPVVLDVPVERAELPNGLEIAVVPNRTMPVVTTVTAFHAGSFIEDSSTNGSSHLFEHMIFNGSEDIPSPIEFRRRLDALGIYSNALTNVDRVAYYFTGETAVLDEAMGLFANALKNPALVESELEREKDVVLGEFDLNEADHDSVRFRRVLDELFGDYVSRVDPLGSRSVVEGMTAERLRETHGTYYVPNNALLVVTGDASLDDAVSLAEAHFGDWARADDPFTANPTPRPRALDRSRYVVLPAPISDTRIDIGWQCPGTRDDYQGALAGRLLAAVTSQSDHSFRRLVSPDLATSATFAFVANQYASYAVALIYVSQGREDEALHTAKDALDHIGSMGDVTRTQLGIAKDSLWSDFFYTADDPERLAQALAQQWSLADLAYERYVDQMYATGPEELDRFAAGCIRGRPHVVVLQSSPENLAFSGLDEAFLESRL